jgi:hypothetical protein
MSYELTISEQPGYVHFRVAGENTPENLQCYLMEVYQVCVTRGYEAILIEESLVGPSLGLLDIFRVISEASPRTVAKIRAIAFVDTQPDRRRANCRRLSSAHERACRRSRFARRKPRW